MNLVCSGWSLHLSPELAAEVWFQAAVAEVILSVLAVERKDEVKAALEGVSPDLVSVGHETPRETT